MGMPLNVIPGAVGVSALTEAGISAEMAASSAAGAAALTGTTPMAQDADSIAFAAALNAAGNAYLAAIAEHVGQRISFSGAQDLAAGTYPAVDAINAGNLGL